VPPIAATLVFVQMFSPDYGPIDYAFQAVGLPTIDWFDDPTWAKPALVILSLWSLGVETLVFLAGLKDVPSDLIEAAQLDGANRWKRFKDVTIPLITPVVLIYRNAFSYFAMGYAAALAVVLFVAVLTITLVIFRSARVWVYYEGSQR
jgi:multiple sugar transport system permease protein